MEREKREGRSWGREKWVSMIKAWVAATRARAQVGNISKIRFRASKALSAASALWTFLHFTHLLRALQLSTPALQLATIPNVFVVIRIAENGGIGPCLTTLMSD